MMKRVLAIHTRDLRIHDNALYEGRDSEVTPVFVFTPEQTTRNAFFGDKPFTFMCECLSELHASLTEKGGSGLQCFIGEMDTTVSRILTAHTFDEVRIAEDYTPYAKARQTALARVCATHGVLLSVVRNHTLVYPGEVCTNTGGVYGVFTPFYKKAQAQVAIPRVVHRRAFPLSRTRLEGTVSLRDARVHFADALVDTAHFAIQPGRAAALALLKTLPTRYEKTRDMLDADDGTSRLSAHHKFGTISPRETYAAAKRLGASGEPLIRQLYWRDFFTHVADAHPRVFGSAYNEKYAHIRWENNKAYIRAWKEGRTGVPVVDAGMRQLVATGYMHNRARMIAASFLVKDLLCDWQIGERFFAQHLLDYDPCVNNGSWQWVAGTGADAAPYFRIFNPWLQGKKFDPAARYIKRFVPELAEVSSRDIHAWERTHSAHDTGYPAPIVEHAAQRTRALALFRR